MCIQQSDNDEKSKQVTLMGDIYSQAYKVYTWLGEVPSNARGYFSKIQRSADELGLSFGDYLLQGSETDLDVWERINANMIISNEYWSRLWIVQEVFNGHGSDHTRPRSGAVTRIASVNVAAVMVRFGIRRLL